MFARLLLLFIVVPLVELALLLQLAEYTSALFTWGLVIVTGIVGTLLARSQGFRTFRRIRSELAAGHIPTASLLDGLLIIIAGALLVTPGLLTDAVGLSLLTAFGRRYYRRWLLAWLRSRFQLGAFHFAPPPQPGRSEIIDSYVVPPGESDGAEEQGRRGAEGQGSGQ